MFPFAYDGREKLHEISFTQAGKTTAIVGPIAGKAPFFVYTAFIKRVVEHLIGDELIS